MYRNLPAKIWNTLCFVLLTQRRLLRLLQRTGTSCWRFTETFLNLTDEEGNPNQDMDPTQYINFIENLARRIVLINGAHSGQTNLIPQSTTNLRRSS